MVFSLLLLVIQFLITGYNNSQRLETLQIKEKEILRDEEEIRQLSIRSRWNDTTAAQVYLQKIRSDESLPGEKIIIIVPKETPAYSIEREITDAKKQQNPLTIPEKWNLLLWGD